MTDKLIPLLKNIKTKEPSVTLAALAAYAEMGKRLGHEVIASDILPALWPMTVGVLLNLEQVNKSTMPANVKFNRLLNVIRELETKVIQQQTQKLQDVTSAAGLSKGASSPLQDTSGLGPMEETTLDFENLVLGKKPAPDLLQTSSPPITAFRNPQSQGFTSSMPTTPVGLMDPMNPMNLAISQTPPPPPQTSFFPPLQPSLYTATTTGPNLSSSFQGGNLAPRKGMVTSNLMSYNASSAVPGAFGGNSWSMGNNSESSFPTIAPPPNKTQFPAGLSSQPKPSSNGLDKYQSLL
jgi:SCY1-like protein 2